MQTNTDPNSFAALVVELVKSSPLVGIAAGVVIALYAIGRLDPEVHVETHANDEVVLEALRLVRETKPVSNADTSSMEALIIRIDKLATELERTRLELQTKQAAKVDSVVDDLPPTPVVVPEPPPRLVPGGYPAADIGAGAGGGGDQPTSVDQSA